MAGGVIAVLTGDQIGGAVSMATETAYRAQWYSSDPFSFEVTDWEPCGGQWAGTVSWTLKRTMTTDEQYTSMTVGGRYVLDESDEQTYTARILAQQAEAAGYNTGTMTAARHAHSKGVTTGMEFCGTHAEDAPFEHVEESGMNGSGAGPAEVSVDVNGDRFNVAVKGQFEYDVTSTSKHTWQRCPGSTQKPIDVSFTQKFRPEFRVSGEVDPKDPNHLAGSKTTTEPLDGIGDDKRKGVETVTYTWNLKRCP